MKRAAQHPVAAKAIAAVGGGLLEEHITRSTELLTDLEEIRALVPYMLAGGILDISHCDHGFIQVSEVIAQQRFNSREPLTALSAIHDDAEGEGIRVLVAGIKAGYLLGLAVGQAVGPDALKGGAR
jgi:hypothetical protein